MNEPNSVVGDILQLVLLAGQKLEQQPDGTIRYKNVLDPAGVKHVPLTGIAAVPTLAPASLSVYLFNYKVPLNSCLLINYCSLYTSASDESSLDVNYGIAYNVSIRWLKYLNGASTPKTPYKNSATLLNAPCFLMFEPGVTASLQIVYPRSGTVADLSIYLQARANGYLLDQNFYSQFSKYETTLCRIENDPS